MGSSAPSLWESSKISSKVFNFFRTQNLRFSIRFDHVNNYFTSSIVILYQSTGLPALRESHNQRLEKSELVPWEVRRILAQKEKCLRWNAAMYDFSLPQKIFYERKFYFDAMLIVQFHHDLKFQMTGLRTSWRSMLSVCSRTNVSVRASFTRPRSWKDVESWQRISCDVSSTIQKTSIRKPCCRPYKTCSSTDS